MSRGSNGRGRNERRGKKQKQRERACERASHQLDQYARIPAYIPVCVN